MLVVEPPIWKICSSNRIVSRRFGVKTKIIWNDHLLMILPIILIISLYNWVGKPNQPTRVYYTPLYWYTSWIYTPPRIPVHHYTWHFELREIPTLKPGFATGIPGARGGVDPRKSHHWKKQQHLAGNTLGLPPNPGFQSQMKLYIWIPY